MDEVELVITVPERDLGGFSVRRILPYATHKMVGPFIFFDHIGPAQFEVGEGIDVRPHPHIHLATVTYLFDGAICHRDSLGSIQFIEPGAINWMIAGHGIVHSERTPEHVRHSKSSLHGIQCWVALPDNCEEMPPHFYHFSQGSLPEFQIQGAQLKLLLGTAFERKSPVPVQSDLFYVDVKLPQGEVLTVPVENREAAAYLIEGVVRINGKEIHQYSMAVGINNQDLTIEAVQDSHLMLLGGKSVGKRYIYWNLVASSKEKIEKAKDDWANGPGETGSRFPKIPTDHQEFIPLPEENTKGTIM